MPEFEKPEAASSSKQNYAPSTDASKKPRTRRRSGGFKTEYTEHDSIMGEVNPAEALKKEKLSGGSKAEPKPKREKSAAKPKPKRERSAKKADARGPEANKPASKEENPNSDVGNAQPSAETLAAIQRVEARLNERKEERAARRAERDKTRPRRGEKKAEGKPGSSARKVQSGGIITSILRFFGLGPKQPAKKRSGHEKFSEKSGQSSRPRGKSGNRPQGQNRRGGGKGRRSGGNGPRRNDRRSQNNKS